MGRGDREAMGRPGVRGGASHPCAGTEPAATGMLDRIAGRRRLLSQNPSGSQRSLERPGVRWLMF